MSVTFKFVWVTKLSVGNYLVRLVVVDAEGGGAAEERVVHEDVWDGRRFSRSLFQKARPFYNYKQFILVAKAMV